MTELYLQLIDRVLTPILMIFALVLLFRGHNYPGGGFIAGLVVATAFQLQILSRGDDVVRQNIGTYLQPLTGVGLSIAALAACMGLLGGTFFKGLWWELHVGGRKLELSTLTLFDVGVFLVVLSIVTSYLLGLSDQGDSELT